jgi:pimeloyl-ACP methyl ester carboxylesterase
LFLDKISLIMTNPKSEVIWLNTNPSFQRFDKPLTDYLSKHIPIAQWHYYQTQDEPCSLDVALILLHDYLKYSSRSIHLIGHSTGGLLGILYAQKYPERVKSLTVLGVGVNPAVDWQAHYYALREILPCSREMILMQMVHNLFGCQSRERANSLSNILEKDLNTSPSPHSLYKRFSIPPSGVSMPLLVCGSQDDVIVDRNSLQDWRKYLKLGDRLLDLPEGRHFFHYFFPKQVGDEIITFWQSLGQPPSCKDSVVFAADRDSN